MQKKLELGKQTSFNKNEREEKLRISAMTNDERAIYEAQRRFEVAADTATEKMQVKTSSIGNISRIITQATPHVGTIGDFEDKHEGGEV